MSNDANTSSKDIGRGQKIHRAFGRDDSSWKGSNDGREAKGMGGSTTNLAHSITGGVAAKQRGK